MTKPISLIDMLRTERELRHFTTTFKAYAGWLWRYYHFHHRQPPRTFNGDHVRQFLIHLAERNVSGSSQNQALNALVFVYIAPCRRDNSDFVNPCVHPDDSRHQSRTLASKYDVQVSSDGQN